MLTGIETGAIWSSTAVTRRALVCDGLVLKQGCDTLPRLLEPHALLEVWLRFFTAGCEATCSMLLSTVECDVGLWVGCDVGLWADCCTEESTSSSRRNPLSMDGWRDIECWAEIDSITETQCVVVNHHTLTIEELQHAHTPTCIHRIDSNGILLLSLVQNCYYYFRNTLNNSRIGQLRACALSYPLCLIAENSTSRYLVNEKVDFPVQLVQCFLW